MNDYVEFNSRMWDTWNKNRNIWTIPVSHEEFMKCKQEKLTIYLTPEKSVPEDWFVGFGKKVLGLASGGGQQGPQLIAHGFDVTIMDNSRRQLAADKLVAQREGYQIKLLKADMTRKFPFAEESFDLVINPVSNCYISDLTNMWQESFRVLRRGGALMTGFTNPIVYAFESEDSTDATEAPLVCVNHFPYNAIELERIGKTITDEEGYQFGHSLEAQLRGQTQAGFLIKDIYEDTDHTDRLSLYTNLFLADLAIKQ